jgi:triacylglycerol lipase
MQLRQALSRVFAGAVLAAVPTLVAGPPASAASADPVVIVPGLFGNGPGAAQSAYTYLQYRLKNAGFNTTIFIAPDYGLGDIHANAARLSTYVDGVLASSGASKVDIVAHSQGGVMARDYIKTLGGADKVDSLVMYGTPNYGAQNANYFVDYGFNCFGMAGCQQIAIGSDFLNALNAGDDTLGSVRYTSLISSNDTTMTPWKNAFLTETDGNIANVNVQDQCPSHFMDHMSVLWDAVPIDGVVDAIKGGPVQLNCSAY